MHQIRSSRFNLWLLELKFFNKSHINPANLNRNNVNCIGMVKMITKYDEGFASKGRFVVDYITLPARSLEHFRFGENFYFCWL